MQSTQNEIFRKNFNTLWVTQNTPPPLLPSLMGLNITTDIWRLCAPSTRQTSTSALVKSQRNAIFPINTRQILHQKFEWILSNFVFFPTQKKAKHLNCKTKQWFNVAKWTKKISNLQKHIKLGEYFSSSFNLHLTKIS